MLKQTGIMEIINIHRLVTGLKKRQVVKNVVNSAFLMNYTGYYLLLVLTNCAQLTGGQYFTVLEIGGEQEIFFRTDFIALKKHITVLCGAEVYTHTQTHTNSLAKISPI